MWGLKCKGQMEEYVLFIHRTPFCESGCTTFRRVVAMESSRVTAVLLWKSHSPSQQPSVSRCVCVCVCVCVPFQSGSDVRP
jgi:hypothetical protein